MTLQGTWMNATGYFECEKCPEGVYCPRYVPWFLLIAFPVTKRSYLSLVAQGCTPRSRNGRNSSERSFHVYNPFMEMESRPFTPPEVHFVASPSFKMPRQWLNQSIARLATFAGAVRSGADRCFFSNGEMGWSGVRCFLYRSKMLQERKKPDFLSIPYNCGMQDGECCSVHPALL